MIKSSIFIRFQFEAMHHWPDAPEKYKYLSSPHRHIFHVVAYLEVVGLNREVEFIDLKQQVARGVYKHLQLDPLTKTWSCEMWAEWLMYKFHFWQVEVSEDGENGALLTKQEEECDL